MTLPYRELEETSLPLILTSDTYFLTCDKCVLTSGIGEGFSLLARFELRSGTPKFPGPDRYVLPRRLNLCSSGGLVGYNGLVLPGMSVPAYVTGRPYELDGGPLGRQELHARAEHKDPRSSQAHGIVSKLPGLKGLSLFKSRKG